MSDLAHFLQQVNIRRRDYSSCSAEQALVYACEDIVESEFGSRELGAAEIPAFVELICQREDIDTPHISFQRSSQRTLASANIDANSICIRGRRTSASTILHEIAHVSSGADGHGILYRDEYIRLTRAHLSVSYAALLHTLFTASDLEMSPWAASASRH